MRLLTLLLIACASAPTLADSIELIEGASEKEKEIRWLWKYAGEIVRACARSGEECQKPEIKPIIDRLAAYFPSEPQLSASAWGQRLQFKSEAANPGVFKTGEGEAHRLAVTELRADAPVIVNTDRMDGVDVNAWVGHLVHESVHHILVPDDERRIPDVVGAAVAAFAQRNFQYSDLDIVGHPEDRVIAFSAPAMDRPARVYMSMRDLAYDTSLTPNARVPICQPGEKFLGQKSESMFWRVNYIRGDQGYLYARGSARVFNSCGGADGSSRVVETSFIVQGELKFWERFDNRSAWWTARSEWDAVSLAGGNYDGYDAQVDLNRTFAVESIDHESPQVEAGGTWRTKLVVYSTDGFVPATCGATLTGSRWFFHITGNMAMFSVYDECKVTPLGEGRFQVDAATKIPQNAQPDLFRLAFVYFEGADRIRYAIPGGKPAFVEIVNSQAAPRMKATAWETAGLEPRTSMMGAPLQNSFRIEYDRPFFIDVGVRGTQQLKTHFLDIVLIVSYQGELHQMPWNPNVSEAPEFVERVEILPQPGGARVRYHLVLSSELKHSDGLKVVGLKFRRASMETDDFTWVEANVPEFLKGVFLTDEVPR